ncbi:PucR family transcriptional regulator [Pseudarthrobacter sp. P1]|uniref:PucR family transcriptional regulator n=1 Tax=Pseudarthrobacter sp. P1 TaxID=3418418 RepID=UPI003CEE4F97
MRPATAGAARHWLTLGEAMADIDVDQAQVLAEPAADTDRVERLCVLDSEDDAPPLAGALVLLAGARGRAALPAVRRLLAGHPAAIAVKGTPAGLAEVSETLRGSGCGLVAVAPGLPWDEFEGMLRQRLGQPTGATAGPATGSPDLFAIAQTAATLTRAHVVIEDAGNRVLAYSPASNDVDELRRLSILARRGPEPYQKLLKDRGIYEQLHAVDVPVRIAADPEHGLRQRVAIGIRAGARMLGYIWLQEGAEPLAPHVDNVLGGSARQAAVELLRQRGGHATAARSERIRAFLGGSAQIQAQARAAGIDPARPAALVLFSATEPEMTGSAAELMHAEVAAVAAVHAAGFRPAAIVGRIGPDLAVILPELDERTSPAALRRLAAGIAADARTHYGYALRAAVGPVAPALVELPATLPLVRGVLAAMAADPRARWPPSRSWSPRCWSAKSSPWWPRRDVRHAGVARLHQEHPELAQTLAAYLDTFGDLVACAQSLAIHRNTVHYRLRRACELSGIELHNPDHRLLAQLQLRLDAAR